MYYFTDKTGAHCAHIMVNLPIHRDVFIFEGSDKNGAMKNIFRPNDDIRIDDRESQMFSVRHCWTIFVKKNHRKLWCTVLD